MMDDETLTALQASIKHWDDNAKAEAPGDASADADDCALCGLFFRRGCLGCPVAEKTGNECCEGSPYWVAYEALRDWKKDGTVNGDTFRAAAAAERDFLISLLPGDAK